MPTEDTPTQPDKPRFDKLGFKAEHGRHLDHIDNYETGMCADVYEGPEVGWDYVVATYHDAVGLVTYYGTDSRHDAYNILA